MARRPKKTKTKTTTLCPDPGWNWNLIKGLPYMQMWPRVTCSDLSKRSNVEKESRLFWEKWRTLLHLRVALFLFPSLLLKIKKKRPLPEVAMDFYLFIYFHLSVIYFEKKNNPSLLENGKDGAETKRAHSWWWKPSQRFDIFSFFLFFGSFFDIFFFVFHPAAVSLMGIVFPWAHLAREPVIDQPDYFPAPIIITDAIGERPPQHLVPF